MQTYQETYRLANITFEDIQKVNNSLITIEFKDKQYTEVNQRIKAFRMLYPLGFIITEIISNENGICVIKASVGFYNEKGEKHILGTGIAYEKEGSTFINKTSYIENCETSAVGRALGMCGFGIDTSVASAEEVQTAVINQELKKPITAEQKKDLEALLQKDQIPTEYICSLYGRKELKEFTREMYNHATSGWKIIKEKYIARQNS